MKRNTATHRREEMIIQFRTFIERLIHVPMSILIFLSPKVISSRKLLSIGFGDFKPPTYISYSQ